MSKELTTVENETGVLDSIQNLDSLSAIIEKEKDIKASASVYLNGDEFNFIVTENNASDATTKIADINKTKKSFKEMIKPIIDKESSDIQKVESLAKDIVDMMTAKYNNRKDEISQALEKTFIARENWIKEYFIKLISKCIIDIDIKSFESCCKANRNKTTWKLNADGTPNKTALDKITAEFDTIANPLIEAKLEKDRKDEELRVLNEQKQKEELFLYNQLKDIKTSGTDDELNNSLEKLKDIDSNIDTLYTSIATEAKRQVSNIMAFVNNGLETNKKHREDVARKEEELRLKEEEKIKEQFEPRWTENKIRSIFEKPYGQMNLSLEDAGMHMDTISSYNFEQFGDLKQFAINIANRQISILDKIRYAIEKRLESEGEKTPAPKTDEGYTIYNILVTLKGNEFVNSQYIAALESSTNILSLKIKDPYGIDEEQVKTLARNKILSDRCDDAIESIEVI